MCLPGTQSSEGIGTGALTLDHPKLLLLLHVSPSREHLSREPETGGWGMAILLSLHTDCCHQEKGARETAVPWH